MPFEIIQNDITRMRADAIVNTANPAPVIGGGTDYAIHSAAGPQLLQARQQVGAIDTGCCAVTPAYRLPADLVIHAVGPVWQGGENDEEALLRQCYDRALVLAADLGCRSVAFPLISTGTYGFPRDRALKIAISAFRDFLEDHDMRIWLVVWDRDSVKISETLYNSVAKYVDEHYVEQQTEEEYAMPSACYGAPAGSPSPPNADESQVCYDIRPRKKRASFLPRPRPKQAAQAEQMHAPAYAGAGAYESSLSDLVRQTDAGFSETLLKLIDKSGKKDPEIYHRANLTKQHFSKIRSNPAYRPTKATALALCIALELDLEQTKDLIGRAGYALTNSSKFDVIVSYFISRGCYDLFEINAALFEFDQLTLGAS